MRSGGGRGVSFPADPDLVGLIGGYLSVILAAFQGKGLAVHEIPGPEKPTDLEELAAQCGVSELKPGTRYIALPTHGKRIGNVIVDYGNKSLTPSVFMVTPQGIVVQEAYGNGYNKDGTVTLSFSYFLGAVEQLPQPKPAARGYSR